MFVRRGGRGSTRFLAARVGLLFLAAGVWIAGVVTGRFLVTGTAIAILLLALVLGLSARGKKD